MRKNAHDLDWEPARSNHAVADLDVADWNPSFRCKNGFAYRLLFALRIPSADLHEIAARIDAHGRQALQVLGLERDDLQAVGGLRPAEVELSFGGLRRLCHSGASFGRGSFLCLRQRLRSLLLPPTMVAGFEHLTVDVAVRLLVGILQFLDDAQEEIVACQPRGVSGQVSMAA
ncbi:MAG: hypothetical protein KA171_16115 [Reyranella sp.]|nr:hypothetical protein [Reyranella sp.]